MTLPSIDKNTYTTDSRFEKLRNQGVTYEAFKNNESYYLQQLSTTSIHDLYNKGKEQYAKYTALYNQSNNLFIQLKNQETQNYAKYTEILQRYANQNNGDESQISSTQKSIAARESGYTTELIRSKNDAECMADVYLDGRRNAISMQRRGLTQSVFS